MKAITRYSDNELIMGSEKGLVLFDKAAANYRIIRDSDSDNATDNSIFSIARDHEGAFWIGTYFGGVNYFSPATNDFLYYNNLLESSSQKYIISGFTDDADGSMLISTHNNNVIYRFDPLRHRREKAFEVSYNNVQSLLRDGDKLYVGVYDRGVDVLSLPSGRPIENLKINIVEGNSIYRIADGGILFDLAMLQSLIRMGHRVICAVKSGFYFFAPTMDDMESDPTLERWLRGGIVLRETQLGKNDLLRHLREHRLVVIDDGTRERLNLYRVSVTFSRAWKEADVVLCKGWRAADIFLGSSHEFTRDIVCYWRDESGFRIELRRHAAAARKFSEEDIAAPLVLGHILLSLIHI